MPRGFWRRSERSAPPTRRAWPVTDVHPEDHELLPLAATDVAKLAGPVGDHLRECSVCQERVHTLQAEVASLRGAADWSTAEHSGTTVDTVNVSSSAGPCGDDGGETLPIKHNIESAPDDGAKLAGPVYSFLAPPQGEGETGCLGDYRVLNVLGTGGMGVVFRALDPHLQRLVALKVMNPALASDASARQRFLREARSTAALKHDYIVTIYQVGEERGLPYLAMELLDGETLDSCLHHEQKLPVDGALCLGRQIAQGLVAAHKRGLLHRDIKPANIWLEAETGRVKI